jgi:alkanesulfonate monooxygenase SsuD/methylene tetrahydromethanopterin reductase-like flavin-dependent oxidoreductase (luciferase family)
MDKPEYRGRFVSFGGVNAMPRPIQKPHPEIVFGGMTRDAYRRAARLANGWFGFALDVDGTVKCVEGLRAACKEAGRRFEELEISAAPRGKIDRDSVRRFAEAGVHRLILLHRTNDERGLLEFINKTGEELVGKV